MSISCSEFLAQARGNPALALMSLLLLAVLLVNGWTDAPNAIATAVASGALSFRRAVLLAAGCNLAGVAATSLYMPAVAQTVCEAADFGGDPATACTALCAALLAVVLWATLAWRFGIPTSESHALLSGLGRRGPLAPGGMEQPAAGRLGKSGPWPSPLGPSGISSGAVGGRPSPWPPPLSPPVPPPPGHGRGGHGLSPRGPGRAEIPRVCWGPPSQGRWTSDTLSVPLWLMAVCALFMALGTLLGGRRIIDKIGRELVVLSPAAGLSADLGGGAAPCWRAPCWVCRVSTTHTKTSAILGAGTAHGGRARPGTALSIGLTWLLTFPGCGALGFFLARRLLRLSLHPGRRWGMIKEVRLPFDGPYHHEETSDFHAL